MSLSDTKTIKISVSDSHEVLSVDVSGATSVLVGSLRSALISDKVVLGGIALRENDFELTCEEQLISDKLQLKLTRIGTAVRRIRTLSPDVDDYIEEVQQRGDKVVDYIVAGIPQDTIVDGINTALQFAAFHGDVELVEQLLSIHQTNINKVNRVGYTAMHSACCGGSLEVVKMLAALPEVNYTSDLLGNTPIQDAASGGHDDIVEFLSGIPEAAAASASRGTVSRCVGRWRG